MDLPAVSPLGDEELKEIQAARREQLEQVYEQQEYARRENRRAMDSYFETSELLNKTAEMLAENSTFIHADPVKTIVYNHTPAVQARHVIDDEGLPFEVKGDKLNYTGKNPEELLNASWDLAAALADRAPYVLENNSTGDIEWLEKHVDGFAATNKTECQRLQQKEVLIDSRIMRTDGTLTEKGLDMVDKMHAEARAAEQDIKGLEAEEQELYADFEDRSSGLMADTTAVAASLPFLMLPIYLVAKRAIDKGKHSDKAKVKAAKETEYNLAKVGKKGKGGDVKKNWYQTTTGKAVVLSIGTGLVGAFALGLPGLMKHGGNTSTDDGGTSTDELPGHSGGWGINNLGSDSPDIHIGSLHYPSEIDGVKIHDSKPDATPIAVVHTGEIGWLNETNDPQLSEKFESWAGKEALERGLDAAKAEGANEIYVEMNTKETPAGRTVPVADLYLYNNQTPRGAPPQNNSTSDSYEIHDHAADPSIAVNGSNLSLPAKLRGLMVVNGSGLNNYDILRSRSLGLLGKYEKGSNNGTLEDEFKAQAAKEGWERGIEAAQRKGGATALFVNMSYKDAGNNKTNAFGELKVLRDKSLGDPDCNYDFDWDSNVTRADIWVDADGNLHYPKSVDNITIVSNLTGYEVNKWDKVPVGPVTGGQGATFDRAKAVAMEVGLEKWFAGQKGGDAVYARLLTTKQKGGSNLTLELAQLKGGEPAWEYWVWDNPGKEVPMKKPFTNNLLGKTVVESQFLPKVSWWRGDTKANKTSYQDFENETTKEIKARGQVAADAIESTLKERGLLNDNDTAVDEIFYEVKKVYDPDKPDTVTMGADLKLVRLPRTTWNDTEDHYKDVWVEKNGTNVKQKQYKVDGIRLKLDWPGDTWKELRNETVYIGSTEVSQQLRDFEMILAQAREKAAETAVMRTRALNGTFNDSATGMPAWLTAVWPELIQKQNGTKTDFEAKLHFARHWDFSVDDKAEDDRIYVASNGSLIVNGSSVLPAKVGKFTLFDTDVWSTSGWEQTKGTERHSALVTYKNEDYGGTADLTELMKLPEFQASFSRAVEEVLERGMAQYRNDANVDGLVVAFPDELGLTKGQGQVAINLDLIPVKHK
jgi:hypothetical protein